MIFYISLSFAILFFSFIYSYSNDKIVFKFSKIVTFLLFYIPLALRKGIGTDYKNYISIYNRFSNGGTITQEIGWTLLCKFVNYFNLNSQWIFIISAFITIYCIFRTPRKNFFLVSLLFLCLFYFESFNIVRQCLAMSLCWYAYLSLINKKKIRSICLLVIAVLFHYATIVFVFALLIGYFCKLNDKTFYLVLVAAFFLIQTGVLEKLFSYLIMQTKYSVYIINKEKYNNGSTGWWKLLTFIIRTFVLLSLYKDTKKILLLNAVNKNKLIRINMCKWLVVFLFMTDLLGISFFMFQRLRVFFFLTYIILILIISEKRKKLFNPKILFYIGFFYCYYFLLRLSSNYGEIIPYCHI